MPRGRIVRHNLPAGAPEDPIFNIRVPLRQARAVEAANLWTTLMARARELGVPGNALPEWQTLLAMEREIGQSNS